MKNILFVLFFILIQHEILGQVAISYYPFNSILSITSNTNKRLFADYKLETNNFVSNLNMEFSPKINFKKLEKINYYVGAGVSINPLNTFSSTDITNGYFLDFGIRAKPFEKHEELQIVFEISPYVNKSLTGGNLRTRLGVAWNFKRNNKTNSK